MKKVNAGTLYALTLSYGHDMIKYLQYIVDTFILLCTLINFDFSKYKMQMCLSKMTLETKSWTIHHILRQHNFGLFLNCPPTKSA